MFQKDDIWTETLTTILKLYIKNFIETGDLQAVFCQQEWKQYFLTDSNLALVKSPK